MKKFIPLLLTGLLTLPTAAQAATVTSKTATKKPVQVKVTQPKVALPKALTDDEMDQATGQFVAALAPEVVVGGLLLAGAGAAALGNKDAAQAANNLAYNIQDGINRTVSSAGEWVGNTFDSANRSKSSEKLNNKAKNKKADQYTKGMNREERRKFHDLKDGSDGPNRSGSQLKEDAARVRGSRK